MKPKKAISPHRVNRGWERRRGDILRTEEAGVLLQTISGIQMIGGDGQATFDVNFPVTFVKIPALSFGAAVDDNLGHGEDEAETSYPEINVMVTAWNRIEKLPGIFYYRGASVSVVLAGSPGYVQVHWQATGMAFRNPAKDLGSTGGSI